MIKKKGKRWTLFSGILENLTSRVSQSEQDISLHEGRLGELEASSSPSIHEMEVKERARVETQEARREALSESELKKDLEKKYGSTQWARKFIKKIISMR